MMVLHHMGPGHRYDHGHQILDQFHSSFCCDWVMIGASEDHKHQRSSMEVWNHNNQDHQNHLQLQRSQGSQPPTGWDQMSRPTSHGSHSNYIMNQ